MVWYSCIGGAIPLQNIACLLFSCAFLGLFSQVYQNFIPRFPPVVWECRMSRWTKSNHQWNWTNLPAKSKLNFVSNGCGYHHLVELNFHCNLYACCHYNHLLAHVPRSGPKYCLNHPLYVEFEDKASKNTSVLIHTLIKNYLNLFIKQIYLTRFFIDFKSFEIKLNWKYSHFMMTSWRK